MKTLLGWLNMGTKELDTLLENLASLIDELESFRNDKELEVTEHLAEAARAREAADWKSAEALRAIRISSRLKELLA